MRKAEMQMIFSEKNKLEGKITRVKIRKLSQDRSTKTINLFIINTKVNQYGN